MAERRVRLDQPRENRRRFAAPSALTEETFGLISEKFARFMGTPYFIAGMSVFIATWMLWNTLLPERIQWDPYPFQFLNVMLSLQASYAAPLILLAQNRQADRDRVAMEQDRSRDERNLADTEFLTREVAGLRLSVGDSVTRDFLRSELRDLLDELEERGIEVRQQRDELAAAKLRAKKRRAAKKRAAAKTAAAQATAAATAARKAARTARAAAAEAAVAIEEVHAVTAETTSPDAAPAGAAPSKGEPAASEGSGKSGKTKGRREAT